MKHYWIKGNLVARWLVLSFLVMTVFISALACGFAYRQKRDELLQDLDLRLLQAATEYEDIVDNFWTVYLSIFQNKDDADFLRDYFFYFDQSTLSSVERLELAGILSRMAMGESHVQWVAAYAPRRRVSYLYFVKDEQLVELPQDFPYLAQLSGKDERMELYGVEQITTADTVYRSIAIAGGTPQAAGEGAILVGYSIDRLEQICVANSTFESLQFDILLDGQEMYSSGLSGRQWEKLPAQGKSRICQLDGKQWYVKTSTLSPRGTSVCYSVLWWELWQQSMEYVYMILIIALLLMIAAMTVYGLLVNSITKEIAVIQEGLEHLGKNELDYRLPMRFHQPELTVIAASVNDMAVNLQDMIEKVYYYDLKQKEAELQELQAKFNPHFLYNTLEIFRARCYENDDPETAELIAQTAAIFRGFIGSRSFIPIREELLFSKRYLALFRARYDDEVQVLYDIDSEVLEYGIIRNIFQPLVENYFEHGYDSDSEENYIRFRGCIKDAETILFQIEDNGKGMDAEAMRQLNERLHAPIATEKESYGLKNLHQRLRLFYGEPCGLTVKPRQQGKGLCIELLIKRMRCEESAPTLPPEKNG